MYKRIQSLSLPRILAALSSTVIVCKKYVLMTQIYYTRQQKKRPVVQYSITLLVLNVSYSNFIHNLLISQQGICEILKIKEPTVIQQ